MLKLRVALIASLAMLLASPIEAGPLRRMLGRRAPACCPPQTYRAPAPCAPAPCAPCVPYTFVLRKCPIWYLGEYDSLHFHFAEIYEVVNGVCTLQYGDWLFAEEPLECPQTCPDGNCYDAESGVQLTTARDPKVPRDGEHKMPPGNHRPASRRTVVVKGQNWHIKVYTYKVDLSRGQGNARDWHEISFGWQYQPETPQPGAPIPPPPEEVSYVRRLPNGAHLVEDVTGEKFPILLNQ